MLMRSLVDDTHELIIKINTDKIRQFLAFILIRDSSTDGISQMTICSFDHTNKWR